MKSFFLQKLDEALNTHHPLRGINNGGQFLYAGAIQHECSTFAYLAEYQNNPKRRLIITVRRVSKNGNGRNMGANIYYAVERIENQYGKEEFSIIGGEINPFE